MNELLNFNIAIKIEVMQQEIEKEKSTRQRMEQEMNDKLANLTKMMTQRGREKMRPKE